MNPYDPPEGVFLCFFIKFHVFYVFFECLFLACFWGGTIEDWECPCARNPRMWSEILPFLTIFDFLGNFFDGFSYMAPIIPKKSIFGLKMTPGLVTLFGGKFRLSKYIVNRGGHFWGFWKIEKFMKKIEKMWKKPYMKPDDQKKMKFYDFSCFWKSAKNEVFSKSWDFLKIKMEAFFWPKNFPKSRKIRFFWVFLDFLVIFPIWRRSSPKIVFFVKNGQKSLKIAVFGGFLGWPVQTGLGVKKGSKSTKKSKQSSLHFFTFFDKK